MNSVIKDNKKKKLPALFLGVALFTGGGVNHARIQTHKCGCGDICTHAGHPDISCHLAGCAKEHHMPISAHRFLIEEDVEHVEKKFGKLWDGNASHHGTAVPGN